MKTKEPAPSMDNSGAQGEPGTHTRQADSRSDAGFLSPDSTSPHSADQDSPDQDKVGSKKLFYVSAALPGLVGLIFLIQAVRLGFGTLASPGAGLWPFFFGAVLIVLSVVMSLTPQREIWPERFNRSSTFILGAVALMAFFIAILPVIGFEVPLFVMLLLWARFIGKESWIYGITLGILGTAGFVLIFSLALGLPLPRLIG